MKLFLHAGVELHSFWAFRILLVPLLSLCFYSFYFGLLSQSAAVFQTFFLLHVSSRGGRDVLLNDPKQREFRGKLSRVQKLLASRKAEAQILFGKVDQFFFFCLFFLGRILFLID